MASVFVKVRIADFARYKAVFDELEGARKEHGVTAHSMHRDRNDPNTVIVALRVADVNRLKEYFGSAFVRSAMERGGVQGGPEIWYMEDAEDKRY